MSIGGNVIIYPCNHYGPYYLKNGNPVCGAFVEEVPAIIISSLLDKYCFSLVFFQVRLILYIILYYIIYCIILYFILYYILY
jgi:hypothetical protein